MNNFLSFNINETQTGVYSLRMLKNIKIVKEATEAIVAILEDGRLYVRVQLRENCSVQHLVACKSSY